MCSLDMIDLLSMARNTGMTVCVNDQFPCRNRPMAEAQQKIIIFIMIDIDRTYIELFQIQKST